MTSRIFDISNILLMRYKGIGRSVGSVGDAILPMQQALREFKASIFQALAHPTRIAIIEALREGELSAGAIIERLGVEQANASQHLSVLRSKQIVVSRKGGNQVYYSLRDPRLGQVLDIMREYFQAYLTEAMGMLQEMRDETEVVHG